jgi:hypothetical protein
LLVAASTQHATGVTVLTAGSGIGAVQVALPHITTAAAPPVAPLPPPAAGTPALLALVPAGPTVLTVLTVLTVAGVPPAFDGVTPGAGICAASVLPHAPAITPKNNPANTDARAYIIHDTRFPARACALNARDWPAGRFFLFARSAGRVAAPEICDSHPPPARPPSVSARYRVTSQ